MVTYSGVKSKYLVCILYFKLFLFYKVSMSFLKMSFKNCGFGVPLKSFTGCQNGETFQIFSIFICEFWIQVIFKSFLMMLAFNHYCVLSQCLCQSCVILCCPNTFSLSISCFYFWCNLFCSCICKNLHHWDHFYQYCLYFVVVIFNGLIHVLLRCRYTRSIQAILALSLQRLYLNK